MDIPEKRYINEEEVRQQHLDTMGPELGSVYHDLYNQCLWLHVKWKQFLELYGTKPERINLLNRAAGLFFRIVHDTLWQDTLISLTRLTDRNVLSWGKNKRENLTLRCLPGLISDKAFSDEIHGLTDKAFAATRFARDWRNRRIAHHDFGLAVNRAVEPLAPASRKHVEDALEAVSRVLERVNEFHSQSELRLNRITETTANDAISLLYVIRDGLETEEKRRERIRERKIEPEDLKGPREI